MLPGNSPVVILKEGTQRDSGKKATQNNIAAAKAIAEAVRSTLGPKGMDKMLVDSMGDVIITNDGVTILKEVEVQHPAAKMIVEIAKTVFLDELLDKQALIFLRHYLRKVNQFLIRRLQS